MATEDKETDDLEVVEVEELPTGGEAPKAEEKDDKASGDTDEADDDDDADDSDEEDSRLADKDVDEDDKPKRESRAKQLRLKRKQARDRTLAELNELREFRRQAEERFAALEGNTRVNTEAQINQGLEKVREDMRRVDQVIAAATTAGNGDDLVEALRIRDELRDSEAQLTQAHKAFKAEPKGDAPDARVSSLKNQWVSANSGWFDPSGADPVSQAVLRIDGQVKADGYDPATAAYWQELSRRAQRFIDTQVAERAPPKREQPKRKGLPPQGMDRQHAPETTRNQVYVTPERKQAMIDAGAWDDPVRRARMLKAYADYDRETRSAGS